MSNGGQERTHHDRRKRTLRGNREWRSSALISSVLAVLVSGAFNYYTSQQMSRLSSIAPVMENVTAATAAPSSKMIAVTWMLENDLLELDALLDLAYMIESETDRWVTNHLLYSLRRSKRVAKSPIGHLNEYGRTLYPEDGEYRLCGWALDNAAIKMVRLDIDNRLAWTLTTLGIRREDISFLFDERYGDYLTRLHSGFCFSIDEEKVASLGFSDDGCTPPVIVTVKLFDSEYRYREIFRQELRFALPSLTKK